MKGEGLAVSLLRLLGLSGKCSLLLIIMGLFISNICAIYKRCIVRRCIFTLQRF